MVSFEVPLYYGVVNKQIMLDQRDSSTVNEESFMRKFLRGHIGIYAA